MVTPPAARDTVNAHVIGETVGSYKLIAKLGEGGMGEVYLAEHRHIKRRAAIKFLLRELSSKADVVSRFFAEARAASVIEHDGIVEIYDCDVHRDGRAYIVMELLSGESLRAYLARVGRRDGDVPGALAAFRQMALALAAAHAQGIVHRDLKPDNVFLHLPPGRDGHQPQVKLLDFGIAKLIGRGEAGSNTRTGQLLGTPLYMSPEQCRGAREVDSRSDIYSFGCIMFEAFCGQPPFMAEGLGDLIIAHVSQPPPEPRALAPGLSPALRDTLLALLAKAPEQRPPSMQALAERLAVLGGADIVRLQSAVALEPVHAPAVATEIAGPPPSGPGPSHAFGATTPASIRLPATLPLDAGAPRGARTTLGGGAAELATLRPRRRGLGVLVIGAAAVAGAVAVFMLRGPGTNEVRPPVATSAPAQPPVPAEAPVPVRPAVSPAAPETVSIQLTGLPDGAVVRLDGKPATVPITVPRGTEPHQLAVEAAGYEPWEREIDGARERSIVVALKRQPPAAAATPQKTKRRSEHRHGTSKSGFSGFSDL